MKKQSILLAALLASSATIAAAQNAPGRTDPGSQSPAAAPSASPGQMKDAGDSGKSGSPSMSKDMPSDKSGPTSPAPKGDKGAEKRTPDDDKRDRASDDKQADPPTRKADDGKGDSKRDKAADKSPGDAAGKGSVVNVPTETKTKVKTVFTRNRVEPARNLNISVSVGVAVPRSVVLHTIPEEVVVIAPAYRSYRYFLVDNRVCIVDPRTYEIVDIIIIA